MSSDSHAGELGTQKVTCCEFMCATNASGVLPRPPELRISAAASGAWVSVLYDASVFGPFICVVHYLRKYLSEIHESERMDTWLNSGY